MDLERSQVDYADISNTVRHFCTQRLYELERSLRPWVDGSFGEINPGHLTGYLGALKELARLYQAHKPPAPPEDMVPVSQVQELVVRMEEQQRLAVQQAVSETETRVRMEAQLGQIAGIEAAKASVLAKLHDLGTRG